MTETIFANFSKKTPIQRGDKLVAGNLIKLLVIRLPSMKRGRMLLDEEEGGLSSLL